MFIGEKGYLLYEYKGVIKINEVYKNDEENTYIRKISITCHSIILDNSDTKIIGFDINRKCLEDRFAEYFI